MIDSISTPFPECIRLLCENIKLDPYFSDFYRWTRQVGIPVIVLSSGMTPIIRALLIQLVGPEAKDIEIVSNEAVDRPPKRKEEEGGWQIKFHDDSGFGHDKSLTIRPFVKHFEQHQEESKPIFLYAGDGISRHADRFLKKVTDKAIGVSDLSAAKETDLLFAKKGLDLVTYCEREHIPYELFEDWSSIKATTMDLLDGKTTTQAVAAASHARSIRN